MNGSSPPIVAAENRADQPTVSGRSDGAEPRVSSKERLERFVGIGLVESETFGPRPKLENGVEVRTDKLANRELGFG